MLARIFPQTPTVQITRVPRKDGSPEPTLARRARRPRHPSRPLVALAVFFVSLFLLTSSGHLDSPDEELMFEVTRSLAERGQMDIGQATSPEQLAQRGADGRLYTHYPPLVSVLNLPFYAGGRLIAGWLPIRYSEVVLRAAVATRDALASAATCVLFYVVASELGYRRAVALPLTLAFGLATLVWPFAKYSWSEPVTSLWLLLAVESALRAARGASMRWSILSSIACGLAIVTKITTAIAAPVLLVYLLGRCQGPVSRRARVAIPFVLLLTAPLISLAVLNTLRFGSPVETGYFLQGYMWHPIGVAGLLVSPSKSLFLYVPLAILGVGGLGLLLRRRPWEAGLLASLVLSHLLLYGTIVVWWHGDAAWGPRYLVPIVPYLILPAGILMHSAAGARQAATWIAFATLAGLGLVVNLGGVLVDQRVSFVQLLDRAGGSTAQMDEQRWVPELSPVLLHWQEVVKRVGIVAHAWSQPVAVISGTYPRERVEPVDVDAVPQPELFPRWTSGAAVFELAAQGRPVDVSVVYLDNRPAALGRARIGVLVNGRRLGNDRVTLAHSDRPLPDKRVPWILTTRLDPAVDGAGRLRLEIRSDTWRPARDAPPVADIRELGVQLWDMRFVSDGQPLAIADAPISPMPVSTEQPWSFELETWFYGAPHLVDMWWWYLGLSGLPAWLLAPAVALLVALGWSSVQLWRGSRGALGPARADAAACADVSAGDPAGPTLGA